MNLSCTSGALHQAIERGDLTQLEFLDRCAHELACDGVVLDVRHFPRTDDDYLAHVKKMATDFGLAVVALADDGFFASDEPAMRATLNRAASLGAPLLIGRLPSETSTSWSEALHRISTATSLAKAVNVTLALCNARGTFAASVHDCKRTAKEADSAWLRFAPDLESFDTAEDPAWLAAKSVALWSDLDGSYDRVLSTFPSFRGHVVLDQRNGAATRDELRSAIRRWRIALAQRELNHT